MKELPEMLFPLIWLEEGADLNKTFVNMLKYQLFLLVREISQNRYPNNHFLCPGSGLKYQTAVKWLSLVLGPIGAVAAILLDYKMRHADVINKVIEVSPAESTTNGDKNLLSVPINEELSGKERY